MATTTGYYIASNPGSSTPAKANFVVSNKSLSANTEYTVSGLSTQHITFACFGTSSSSRLYLSYLSVTYSGGQTVYYTTNPQCTTQTAVTLNPNGGTISTGDWIQNGTKYTQTVETTDDFTLPTPVKEGYTFGGWYESSTFSGSAVTEIEAGTTGTKEFWAKWTAEQYTVQLDNQGATTAGATSVTATYNAAMPSIANNLPKKTGYAFQGYFDAISGGTKYYNADGTSAKNWDKTSATTLYAQWECVTPVFDIKIKNDNPVVFSGESIELTVVGSNIAADAAYQWYKYNGATYDELAGETTNKLTIAEATANDAGNYKCVVTNGTCSAENNYTVKMYHIKGLTDGTWTTPFEFVKSGDKVGTFTIELAATTTYYFKLNDGSVWYWNEGTMTHNNCTDWVIEQQGADTQGKANTGITTTASGIYIFTLNYEDPSKPKLSVIYPAKRIVYLEPNIWASDNPKFAVHAWGGATDEDVLMTKIDDCADRNIYFAEIDAAHTHVIFIRGDKSNYSISNPWNNVWNRTVDLTLSNNNLFYVDNWNDANENDKSNGYWKNFTPNYSVTFDANGHGTAPADQCIAEGGKVTTPTAPTATGYTFGGWYKEAGCTNAWDFAADIVSADITLYAKWTAKTITITWNANGGTVSPATATYTYDGAAVELPTPTRTGYTFNGWFTAASGGTKITEVGTTNKPATNVTYYAQWTPKQITITWDANGGSVSPATATYTYDGAAVELPTPTRANYIFDGWFTAASSGTKITEVGTTNKPAADVTYYAHWTAKATPTFAWSADSYTAALEADNTFPTLNNPNSLSVTYTSSDENVAKIDANGNIILVATGTTTITAIGAETATHKSATDSYELTVVAANCKWIETSTIEDGDEVVITTKIGDIVYALPNNYGTSTPGVMIVNNIKNNEIPSVSNDIKWTIEEKQGEQYIFHPNGDLNSWLYCTNSNDGVRVGTNANKTFVIGQNLESITHVATGRSIRIGSTDLGGLVWRCYTTTSDQTLKLYKRECLDVTKVWVEGNLTNVTCTPQLPQQLAKDASITLTFTAADGYALPNDVTVTNATKTWNKATGTLTISNPTGNVMVTISAVELHTITWMVGSTSVLTEEVANATGVTKTPANPANGAIGECANAFMGWTETPLGSAEGQSAPADLCTAAQMKAKHTSITGDKTFYAVFATEEPSNTTTTSSTTISGANSGTIANVLSWSSSKNDGTAITAWNDNHFRLYPNKSNGNGSSITITPVSGVTISEVVLTATSTTYAKPVKYNIDGGSDISGTWSSTTMTISDINATSSFKFRNAHTGANNDQLRVNIEVTYSKLETTTTYSDYVTQCCTDWTPTLTYSKTTLDSESSETATPTITGNTHNAAVSFESSNTSVLKVDANNGTITAVGAGKATITATWEKTGDYCEKSITTDEITVNGNFLVTFYANDGSGNTTTQTMRSNTPTALTANTFQREGYTFQGWATSANGSKVYDDQQSVTLTTSGLDLYAVWKINAYQITIGTITGNGTITTSPASSANYEAQVTITATPAAHYTLASVTVTRDDNSQTVVVVGNKFTMPASDVTITAVFTENEKFAINYAIPAGGGEVADDAPTWIYNDGSITLPNLKDGTIAPEYSCEELIGWTTLSTYENANGQKPNPFYAIGASLSGITQNTTLYAVYSRAGEGASGTVELTCTDVSTWKSNVLSGNNNTYGTVTTRTAADGSVWKTNGQIQNAGGIDLKENYYIQIPTLPGPATSITMKVSQGNIGSGEDACTDNVASPTSRAFHFRSADNGSNLFTSETTSSRSRTINITEGNYTTGYIINGEGTSHVHSVTVAYGSPNIISTSLNCSNDIDEFTITYNLNQSSVVSGTQITGVCESGVTYKFSEITEYTICSAPRANGYQLVGWNTQANGKGGLTYTPGQVITSVPLSTLTLYAQWAPVVSLSDVGNISTVNANTVGGSVTLPDGENGCDPYEFIGWTEVYPSWNETAQLPTLVANPYTPTAPITLYAVYTQRTTAGAFTDNGAGGVYEIWVNNSAKNHMSGQINSSNNLYTTEYWDDNYTEANKTPFTITKIGENTYTIQNTDGHYITKHSTDNKLAIEDEWDNLDRYKWTVSTGTNGSWRFTNKAATTYALIYYNNYFRLYSASNVTNGSTSYYDLELTPVESAVYYSAPSCGDYAIHFYTHGGEFVQGDYAYPTAITEGLNGTVETKFPSATLNGYTFVGWKENAPQDELTDNSPEGDTSAEPYGLKKPGDDLITTTRREFHAVYYYYDELQDVDLSGPITTSIFAENNAGELRFLSGTPSNNPGTLSSTTACGDVAVVKITPGTGENTGKYTININGYNIIPQSGEAPGVERGTAWWYIEETSTGSGEYKIYVQNGRNIVLNGVSFGNYAYNAQGSYNGDYHYVRFGNCREHHWASDPKRKPSIILSSSGPLTITSAAGQTIKSINKLFVGATRYETQTKIYLTCDVDGVGLLHEDGTALSSDANGEYLTTTAEGELASTNLILTYSPTITTDGIETVTITAQDAGNQATANRLAEVRHLPNTFAIVAKVGGMWYALPSQGLNSTDALVGYPVEVDNLADPTAVTAVPTNADWSLRQVYASTRDLDRFKTGGHNLVFVNNVSPEKALNPSSSSNYLLTNAQYNNYHNATIPGLYEWTPTTTDLETYQLTNVSRTDKQLNIATNTVFGVHATEVVTADVRFLPIQNRYTPMAAQVVEWKENSVVVMYNGDPAQTASVSVNAGAAQTTELSSAQKDIAVYELAATGLAANPTQQLIITIGTEKVILPIPYIISGAQTDLALLPGSTVAARQEVAKVADLVVLKGAKLTADGAQGNPYKFRNVTVYGGGKLVVPADNGFGVASLTLRAGGITDVGEYDYVYPQFELRGTFTNTAGKFYYDYITDYDHWYHLVLPFAGDLGTIKYPTEFYGANVAANNKGSWQIKRYAGEIRATGNYNAWKDIETEGETSTTAGKGYIFWGAPKKVSVNGGASTRQTWGIQRITMSVTAPNAMTAENGDKAISELSSYANVPNNSGKDNDQGWNLVGNPYMVNLTGLNSQSLQIGQLIHETDASGNWTGKWQWDDTSEQTGLRYVTIPSDHFETYEAKPMTWFTESDPMIAGRSFFVQIAGAATDLVFDVTKKAALMPALLAENSDKPVDIETGIILSNETLQDEVNFWIKDGKTNDYEYNADYPKTPNNNHFNIYGVHTNGDLSWVATGPEYAAESMPIGYQVPAAGTYTLSISETYYSDLLDALYVTDHAMSPEVTVDLMSNPYEFSVNQAETNNERFTVSMTFKSENQGPTTDLENTGTQHQGTIKFIYQDRIFILHNGTIYDATGKQVTSINK
ncbi:MAG: InlB B-repeat-containing protein [Paludibacteraceae bacterium]|nr:InlB B-repeat-containing protein [Paludibacteraceae bacterium]